MFNLKKCLGLAFMAVALFTGCKEFIEPSLSKKNVTLLAPANGAETNIYAQTFWWETLEDALKYRLQVVSPDFDHPVRLLLDTLVKTNKFTFTLDPGNYQFRVRAENGSSQSPYSISSFKIYPSSIKDQQVQLSAPANNLVTNQSDISFKWQSLYGATQYRLQVDTNSFVDETNLFIDRTIPGLEFPANFVREKTYQWRVKALDATTESKWSVIQSVTFNKTPPPKVVLTSPANNETVVQPVTLKWESLSTAKKYELNVYKNENRVPYSSKYPVSLTTNSYIFNEGRSGEKLFWEVRAIDAVGNTGPFSDLRSFVIQ